MNQTPCRLLTAAILLVAVQDAGGDDREWVRRSAGLTAQLLAVSDGLGNTWHPAGAPLGELAQRWTPQGDPDAKYFDMEARTYVAGQSVFCLFLVTSEGEDRVAYTPRLRFASVSYGRGNFEGGYPQIPDGQRLDAIEIVVPGDLTELTIELLCSTGPWDRVADVEARKNSGSTTSFRDGGRPGVALMTSVGYHGRGLTAAASLALRDTERLEESYRLAALDNEGSVLASTERFSSGGYVGQMVLECPTDILTPAKFQLQQRPKIPLVFRDIALSPPVE